MSSIGYGQYSYGVADYGTPTYHFGEVTISALAGMSPSPSLVYQITNETINVVSGVSAQGSQILSSPCSISATSNAAPTGTKILVGTPLPIIQASGFLAHGTQVDQAEIYVQIDSGFTASGVQVFQGVSSITQTSNFTSSAVQVDLGVSSISSSSSLSASGVQVDLGISTITATSNVPNITGIQIDLGASADCIEISNLGTDSPVFATLTRKVTVNNGFVIEGTSRPALELASGYIHKFDVSDSSNANHNLYLGKIIDGINNNSACKLFVLTDASGNEYIQMSGASPVTTSGGAATNQLRTLYHYTSDTGTSPTYTGMDWAYVYPTQTVTVDSSVTATVSYQLVSGYYVLTINGKPVYQYTGDTKLTANGVGGSWRAFKSNGTLQSTTPSGTMTSGIIYSTNVTRSGTAGNSGAYVQFASNTADDLDLFYFSYEDQYYGNSADVNIQYAGVESTLTIVGPPITMNTESNLISSAVMTLVGNVNIDAVGGITGEGVIKWQEQVNSNPNWNEQNTPSTTWTEKTIAA